MKSTALKKNGSIPIRKYVLIYSVLFVGALMLFLSHFYETPFRVDDVRVKEQFLEEKSEVGYRAPGFTVRNLNGNRESFDKYQGQVILLNLWATWCGPCRVEMPAFEKLYRRFRSEGLTVLAVSMDKGDPKVVHEFVEQYGLSFPVVLDEDQVVERRYPTFTLPMTYVIDRQGRIVTKVDGVRNWESEETYRALKMLLGPPDSL